MNDKTTPAKNPALKVQAAREKIMFGKAVEAAPQRAEIIQPGKDKAYTQKEKGGIAAKPVKAKKKAAKPIAKKTKAKAKPRPKKVSPAEQSQNLAEEVVLSFTYKLIDEARAKGGYLSVADLKTLNKDFQNKTADMKLAIEKSFEDYVVDHDRKSWSNSRTRPFDRMMVKTFSHLLEDESRRIKRSELISRRMLPGFFVALNLMLGADMREAYQGKCRAIVKIVGQRTDGDFDWDDIYENEDARAIAFDALVDIAGNFSDLNKRRGWFIDLVNSHLAPVTETAEGEAEAWALNAAGFDEFFEALTSELRVAVSMQAGRSLITRRRDAETTASITKLMKKLRSPKKA